MGSLVFDSFTGGFERRIGRRVPVDGIDVLWVLGRDRPRRLRRRLGERLGCVEDVSVTGARIRGPADLAVEPTDRVVIRYQGHDSVVIVRHATATGDVSQACYGVELAAVHPTLRRRLDEASAATHAIASLTGAPASATWLAATGIEGSEDHGAVPGAVEGDAWREAGPTDHAGHDTGCGPQRSGRSSSALQVLDELLRTMED